MTTTALAAPENTTKWEDRLTKAKSARSDFERQWYTNIAYFRGRQWVMWNASRTPVNLGQMIEPAPDSNRTRLVVNVIRRIIRKELARINKETIRGFTTPNTSDNADIAATRAADKLVEYLTDVCDVATQMKRADFWMLLCGTAFLKDTYDPTFEVGGALGGPVVECVSPFHLFVPNLDEPDIERQPWVMHVVVRDPTEIENEYGVKIQESSTLASSTVESQLLTVMGMTKQQAKQRGVEVKEVWVKPNAEYPEGLRLVWCAGQVLDEGPFPYAHGQFPFTRRQYIESGMFYADTIITDLIPLQTEYNKTRSQLIEDKNKMAVPMLTAQEGSINVRKIRNVAGEILFYRPGTNPPTPIQLSPIPSYVIQLLQTLTQEMDRLASQDTDQQTLPPGVTAATAIAYLQEDQSSLVVDTVRDKEKAWQKVIRHFLSYIAQYWDAEHTVKSVGMSANFEAFMFKGSDLHDQTDWRVVVGSGTPKSYPAQQAQIMELLKMGVVPAPTALQHLDLGDTARLYEEMQIDVREAELENNKMMTGVFTPVTDWQDHIQHLMAHDAFRKREEYSDVNPQIGGLFDSHTFIHICYFMMTHAPGMPLPWDPQLLQAYISGQMPVPPQVLIQARGLLSVVSMGSMAPVGGAPTDGHTSTEGQ